MTDTTFGDLNLDDLAHWRHDGFFSARRGDGVHIKGVAGDQEALAELLKRADVLKKTRSVYRARPNAQVRDFGWSDDAGEQAGDLDAELEHQLAKGRPTDITQQLHTLAHALPHRREDLQSRAQTRADELNHATPQIGSHCIYMPPFDDTDVGAFGVRDSALRGWAMWADWIPAHLMVSTNAPIWNVIDRHPVRATIVRTAEWLRHAITTDTLEDWLAEMFLHDPMRLNRVEGPAGPMYEVISGTHRAHAARIWGFPQVLVRVQVDRLPKPLRPHTPALARLWEGLRQRGLFQADVIGDTWYSQWISAEWLLTPPAIATQWNAAYERVYPGALQAATGVTMTELLEPDRWARTLLP